ncbi:hypothetical protein [Marinicella sp. W31]|uniref:hypothetical protein n=1 Tax=Marinicella sp. W31 TaxID=3023713 RepID=UPI003757C03F
MKSLSRIICILAACNILLSCAGKTARVTFTGTAPEKYETNKQPLEMYACNNTSIVHNIAWGEKNPKTIPYGRQVKDGKEYFISKYYIASPPLPNKFVSKEPLILGVLSKDHFTLDRADQNVDIFMDYQLLKPIHLAFLPVVYTRNESEAEYCLEKNIHKIPINIRCPEFNYTQYGKEKTGKSIGLGKGIGQLKMKSQAGELVAEGDLFIPIDKDTKKALENCTVEIVNDIILDHQIYFGSAQNHHQKINLTQAYKAYKLNEEHVTLYCKARPENEPASGCGPISLRED